MRRVRLRFKRFLALTFIACIAAFLAAPGVVSAHASLIDSSPKALSALTAYPESATLYFDANLDTALIAMALKPGPLLSPGEEILRYETSTTGASSEIQFSLPAGSPTAAPGEYLLHWRAYSLDGHTMEGFIPFTVQSNTTEPSPTPPAEPTPTNTVLPAPGTQGVATTVTTSDASSLDVSAIARSLLRLVLMVGASIAAGAMFWPRTQLHQALVSHFERYFEFARQSGLVVMATSSVLLAANSIILAVDTGLTSTRALATVASSSSVFPFVVLAGVAVWSRRERIMTIPALGLAAFATAAASHAVEEPWWAVSVGFASLHWASVVAWMGPLLTLAVLRNIKPVGSHDALPTLILPALKQYSTWAYTAVSLAVISGTRQAIAIADGVPGGTWGTVLFVKLGIVALAVAPFGIFHHLAIKFATQTDGTPAPTLRTTLTLETVGAVLTVVAAVVLSGINPYN